MNDDKIKISILIIGQDCESFLVRCLDSIKDFAEVVFVDGGSSDNTEKIARSYDNVQFFSNPWPGFIKQRNFSIQCASYDWCLMIDTDEALTPELVDYLRAFPKEQNDKIMYRIVRTEYLEGQAVEIGHGASEYQERLFLKKHIQYTGGIHHQHLIDGELLRNGDPRMGDFPYELRILHNPDYSLEDMIKKLPRFAMLIANEKLEHKKNISAPMVIFEFVGSFFKFWLKSWRGGKVSFVLCAMKALQNCLVKLYIYNHYQIRKNNNSNKDFEKRQLG